MTLSYMRISKLSLRRICKKANLILVIWTKWTLLLTINFKKMLQITTRFNKINKRMSRKRQLNKLRLKWLNTCQIKIRSPQKLWKLGSIKLYLKRKIWKSQVYFWNHHIRSRWLGMESIGNNWLTTKFHMLKLKGYTDHFLCIL